MVATKEQRAIVDANRALLTGLVEADVPALDALLSPNFVAVHITGREQSKADWLQHIADGRMAYHRVDEESARCAIDGDTAVLVTRNQVLATIGGARARWPLESTTEYVRTNGAWLIRRSAAATY